MTKTVLLTGGAGFIGHHIIDLILSTTDWNIVSLDRLDYSGNLNRIGHMLQDYSNDTRKRLRVVWHDLRADPNPLLVKQIGPVDIILHVAAGSHVDRSISNPMEFVMDNVVGTCNILEFARKQENLERFVYFSTDEIFGPAPLGIKYTERDRYNSTNPYSASKAGGEELAVAYHNTYNLPVYITHTMNVFGERQHPEKFIPICIRKILSNESVTIHSNSECTVPGSRHYIHAADVADAIMFLLNNAIETYPDYGGARCPKFNIVGNEEVNNLELARLVAETLGKELKYDLVDFHSSRPGHDVRYALSGSYMKKLGWEPKFSFNSRLPQVVKWTVEHPEWLYI